MTTKPLGIKAYGSTPHLIGSRMGPGDHHVHEGQSAICTTKARDKHDRIILTEKLDGSNVAVAIVGQEILALTRAGYLATTSPYEQHHLFAAWVKENGEKFDFALSDGEVMHGEWLAQAHGTRYELPHGPFVAFGMSRLTDGKLRRFPWDTVSAVVRGAGLPLASVLSDGPPVSIEDARHFIRHSRHGAIDPVEGAVWRVERKGEVDLMAKWVDPAKEDGKFLPQFSGNEAIWNWRPSSG